MKMNFPLGKMELWTHSNVIFFDKYLKFKEIEYLIHYAKFIMWPVGNSAYIAKHLALGNALLVKTRSTISIETLKAYME